VVIAPVCPFTFEAARELGRHRSAAEMGRALSLLQGKGKLQAEQESAGEAKGDAVDLLLIQGGQLNSQFATLVF
jgi:hypothetical protein